MDSWSLKTKVAPREKKRVDMEECESVSGASTNIDIGAYVVPKEVLPRIKPVIKK